MWPKPKQLTRRWEAVATGPSYCRRAGMTGQGPEGTGMWPKPKQRTRGGRQ